MMLWSSKTMRSRWEARSPSMYLWLESARSSVRTSCVCWATVRWSSMACAKGLGLSGRGRLPSRQPPALLHVAWSQGGSSALTQRRADARCPAWQGPRPCGCGHRPACLHRPQAQLRLRAPLGMMGASSLAQAQPLPTPACSPQPVTDGVQKPSPGLEVGPTAGGWGALFMPALPRARRRRPRAAPPAPSPRELILSSLSCPGVPSQALPGALMAAGFNPGTLGKDPGDICPLGGVAV